MKFGEPSSQVLTGKISKTRHDLAIKIAPSRAVLEAGMLARGFGHGLRGDGLGILIGSDGDRLSEGNDSPDGGRVRLPYLS
jgi:hypothetical protein